MDKEVFKAGKWTDSSGRTRAFTEEDIDGIVASFNEQTGKNSEGRNVPLVIGHPSGDAPAYGWIEKVWRDGKKMFAKFKDIPEKMQNALKQDKLWKDVSISLNGIKGHVLQHIGLTNFPAVAGMEGFQFKSAEETVSYSQLSEDKKSIIETLKSWFKENKAEFAINNPKKEQNKMSNEKELKEKLEDLEKQNLTFSEQIENLDKNLKEVTASYESEKKDHDALKASIENEKIDSACKVNEEFVNGLITAKKLHPREKDTHINVMNNMVKSGPAEFTNGKGEKEDTLVNYKKMLGERSVLAEFELMPEGEKKVSGDPLDVAVKEYMQENGIEDQSKYADCLVKVVALKPELQKNA